MQRHYQRAACIADLQEDLGAGQRGPWLARHIVHDIGADPNAVADREGAGRASEGSLSGDRPRGQAVHHHRDVGRHRCRTPHRGGHHVGGGHAGVEPRVQHVRPFVGEEGVLAAVGQVEELHVLPAGGLIEKVDGRIGRTGRCGERHLIPVIVRTARTGIAVLVGGHGQGVSHLRHVVGHAVGRDAVVLDHRVVEYEMEGLMHRARRRGELTEGEVRRARGSVVGQRQVGGVAQGNELAGPRLGEAVMGLVDLQPGLVGIEDGVDVDLGTRRVAWVRHLDRAVGPDLLVGQLDVIAVIPLDVQPHAPPLGVSGDQLVASVVDDLDDEVAVAIVGHR